MDGEWMLLRSADDVMPPSDAAWQKVVVPHLVGDVPDKPFLWYRKTVKVPAEWGGRHLFLHFEGVKFVAEVYVDGKRVGGHAGGFEPWEIDLRDACAVGREHEICLRVRDITGLFTSGGRIGNDPFRGFTARARNVLEYRGNTGRLPLRSAASVVRSSCFSGGQPVTAKSTLMKWRNGCGLKDFNSPPPGP